MKKQLLKMFYTCLPVGMAFIPIVIGMFSLTVANAQIIYTDIIPDTTVNTNNGVYHLDLNNDGITDFNITYDTTFISAQCPAHVAVTGTKIDIMITPLGANQVGNDPTYPSALLLNSNIESSSFTWKNNANQILTEKYWHCLSIAPSNLWISSYYGNWNGAVDKYIPLRLDVSSQKYYGWVRLDVQTGAVSFTVKDYAYNSIPDSGIIAGQTITGISENISSSSIALYPNPATNQLAISLGSYTQKIEVTITDITGKIIYAITARETNKIAVNTNEFAEGIYTVQIQTAGFIGTKKLVVEK